MAARTKTAPNPPAPQPASRTTKSRPVSAPPLVVREDWHGFCDLDELPRKAGVPPAGMAKLLVKELADNALDAAGACKFGRLKGNGFYVQNQGDIPGGPPAVAMLFSVGRPQTSSKLYRQAARGMLGNGWRVLAGAVFATGGRIVVRTAGLCLHLTPRADGTTAVRERRTKRLLPEGVTRVAVWLGPAITVGPDALDWAALASEIAAARGGKPPPRPSAHHHTPQSFADLLRDVAAGTTTCQVVECFSGLSGSKASEVCGELTGPAAGVTPAQAVTLFDRMKAAAGAPGHASLGRVGHLPNWGRPRVEDATFTLSGAEIPARIEAWARPARTQGLTVCVNGTPCPAPVSLYVGKNRDEKNGLIVSGAGCTAGLPARPGGRWRCW